MHVRTTCHPTSEWTGQQIVEACGWHREPPRFLIHDRDSRYGAAFHRRIRNLGITSIRTPFRSPRANAIAERWVRSVRTECLDHLSILNERHLRRVLVKYVAYFNRWRPHRSVGQRARCAQAPPLHGQDQEGVQVIARSVLGGLHHVYDLAAKHDRSSFCALQAGNSTISAADGVLMRHSWMIGRFHVHSGPLSITVGRPKWGRTAANDNRDI